uniref:Uncharacterized protein n=1 Tax=Panagrolaimus sp. PS1159 TaxID=55785 RepID=A0AC35FNE7_9BILA
MGIIIPTLHSICHQQITSLWITMAMAQTTIEKNGCIERKIKFDNGTFLEISLNGIKDAFGLNLDGIGDGFLLGLV